MAETIVSTVNGMSNGYSVYHKVYLAISGQSTTTSGATGTTTLTWKLYYDTTEGGYLTSNSTRETKFTLAGQSVTASWTAGTINKAKKLLATGSIKISRDISNSAAYNIKGKITSTHILTATDTWSTNKAGSEGTYGISKVTLATNVTAPTSVTSTKSRVAYTGSSNNNITINWSGATSGTNNTISGYYIQFSKNGGSWTSYNSSLITTTSKAIDIGASPISATAQGDTVKFRVGAYGKTLKDTKYSSTSVTVTINKVPSISSVTSTKTTIARNVNTDVILTINASDGNNDGLTYQYSTDKSNWTTKSKSFSHTFAPGEDDSTLYFKVNDGYNDSNTIELDFTRNSSLFISSTTVTFYAPDTSKSKLTNSISSAKLSTTGGSGTKTIKWTFKAGESTFSPSNTTSTTLSNIGLSSLEKGKQIYYSVTVTDSLGDSSSANNIATGYYIPLSPSLSNVTITNSGYTGTREDFGEYFYKDISYTIIPTEGNYYSTPKEYTLVVLENSNEINQSFTTVSTSGIESINGSGINTYGLRVTMTDYFGQTISMDSNSLTRLLNLSDLFTLTGLQQNPTIFRPYGSKNSLNLEGDASYKNIPANKNLINYGYNFKITCRYNNIVKEAEIKYNDFPEDVFNISTSRFTIKLDSQISNFFSNENFNIDVSCIYTLVLSNDFGDDVTLISSGAQVDFRETPFFKSTNFGWRLNEDVSISNENTPEVTYYLSYGDKIYIPIVENVDDENFNHGNGLESLSYQLQVVGENNSIVEGTYEFDGTNLIWTNANRASTIKGLSFKITVTDSTGNSTTKSCLPDGIKIYACKSELPKLSANVPSGNKEVTITVDNWGHDETYKNYFIYNSNMDSGFVILSGTIYRSTSGYSTEEKGIELSIAEGFEEKTEQGSNKSTIDNITDGFSSPSSLYCTYVSTLTTASGITYETPNLTWVWFGEAPTISPRKNRLGINVKAEEMRDDAIIQISAVSSTRTKIYFKDSDSGELAYINLGDLSLNGFIIDGGTWGSSSET